jgi:hypothetical protein
MQFTYTADDERDYPEVDGSALHAVPGQTYELSTAPDDGRWTTAYSAPVSPVTPPQGGISDVVGTAEGTVTPPEGA